MKATKTKAKTKRGEQKTRATRNKAVLEPTNSKGMKGSSSKRDDDDELTNTCKRKRGGTLSKTNRKPKDDGLCPRITCQVPICVRPGKDKDSNLLLVEALEVAQNAVEFYNSSHKGEEIQFLELSVACIHPSIIHTVFHVNFMAKPVNVDSDQSPNCFFAEDKPNLRNPEHLKCEKLVEGSVGGSCKFCPLAFGIVHPSCGFRGFLPRGRYARYPHIGRYDFRTINKKI